MIEFEKYMRFPQGKQKAFTLSYDDGVMADKTLVQYLAKYGALCTFNLNSGLFDTRGRHNSMNEEECYQTFVDTPHEIALHGHRHLFLTKVPTYQGIAEIVQNRQYLESKFGRVVDGMAYAFGAFNEEIKHYLALCDVKYSRTTHSTGTFELPVDFLQWNPTCHHVDKNLPALTKAFLEANPLEEYKHRESLLFYVWGHSYEFDDNNDWYVMENLLAQVCGRDDVWYATNGQIYRYVTAYNSLVWSVDDVCVYNPSAVDVWVERNKVLYCVPSGQTININK